MSARFHPRVATRRSSRRSKRLRPGAGFELVNDHDPRPLYYQFAAERPGAFTWDYLESGPELWRVRIGRSATSAAKQMVPS